MPWPWRTPEDARIGVGPGAEPTAHAALRPHTLTQELLDWSTAALEAVIRTPEFAAAPKRVQQAILDGYKYIDYLWPLSRESVAQATLHELANRDTGVTHDGYGSEGEGLAANWGEPNRGDAAPQLDGYGGERA